MNHLYIPTLLCMLILSACNKKPTVGFSASSKTPDVNQKVTFSNTSSGAVRYVWDFGDGHTSTEQSPVHSYDTEGTYDVTLTAFAKNDRQWNKFTDQVVVQHPDALFTGMLNGVDTKMLEGVGGVTESFAANQVIMSGVRNVVYSCTIGTGISGKSIKVELGTLSVPSSLNLNQTSPYFHDLIKVERYYYSSAAVSGIRISYNAPSGIVWSTDAGLADQTGSSFVITYTENSTSGTDRERFKAHFNCTLYDGLGDSMTITDGVFELDFANI